MSDRNKAFDIMTELMDRGLTAEAILNYIVGNYLAGHKALEIMESSKEEFFRDEE